jgi:hypothetical protein
MTADADLRVEVQGGDIIVTLPGTNFMVTYFKPAGTSHLIARPNWTDDPDASIELGEFLTRAWTAAHDKARELGWIVKRRTATSERRMDRNELWRSVLLILALLALVVLAAQSRRNCEVPGSSFVPCVSFKVLWNSMGR